MSREMSRPILCGEMSQQADSATEDVMGVVLGSINHIRYQGTWSNEAGDYQ
jgi:hypothetical protein